jgi:hypothetical protein
MDQIQSLQRLARLPHDLELFPTHGEGSFCSASSAGRQTSTIGSEKRTNPLLRHETAAQFAAAQLAGLQPYPKYYAFMVRINTLGPDPLPRQMLPALWVGAGWWTRVPVPHLPTRVSRGHSVSSSQTTSARGWLAPFNTPIALVLDPGQDLREAMLPARTSGKPCSSCSGSASTRSTASCGASRAGGLPAIR